MKRLLLALLALSLISCNMSEDNNSAKEMANTHLLQGKPSAPIEMKYEVTKPRVAVGESSQISVAFTTIAMKEVEAQIIVSPELLLQGSQQLTLASKQQEASTVPYQFLVTPLSEGIHYVNVFAQQADKNNSKPFAIRIIAGDKPLKDYLQTNGSLQETSDGEKIISMPAEQNSY